MIVGAGPTSATVMSLTRPSALRSRIGSRGRGVSRSYGDAYNLRPGDDWLRSWSWRSNCASGGLENIYLSKSKDPLHGRYKNRREGKGR
jgi:hypothetical protein